MAPELMRHRGPDEASHALLALASGGYAGLAQARLAVIDLARNLYPISNETGSVHLVANAEIYNFQELRKDLEARGHRFRTRTDTETLVHLYEENGSRLLNDLEGMFAFAIVDTERSRLLLARDRFGEKPLYLHQSSSTLFFASELRVLALLALRDTPRFDEYAFGCYLRLGYAPGRQALISGIERLLPAEVLEASPLEEVRSVYYRPEFGPCPRLVAGRTMSLVDAVAALEPVLEEAVRRRLVSDRPVGIFLSGGIDSGLVASFVASVPGSGASTPIAFTAGPAEVGFDERPAAAVSAERAGLKWRPLEVPAPSTELISELAWALDEPMADSSFLPTYLLCRAAAQEIVVALSGDAGDELFGGYERYQAALLALRLRRLGWPAGQAAALFKALAAVSGRPPTGRLLRLWRFLDVVATARGRQRRQALASLYERILSIAPAQVLAALTGRPQGEFLEPGPVAKSILEAPASNTLDILAWADLNTYLPYDILHKVDRASMAHGLEVRVPFLDRRVQELAFSLPAGLKVGGLSEILAGHGGKKILRRLFARRLGEGARRPKKGFGVPVADWFRSDAGIIAERIFKEGSALAGSRLLSDEAVLGVIAEHRSGRDHSYLLWALVVAELWLRRADSACPGEPGQESGVRHR